MHYCTLKGILLVYGIAIYNGGCIYFRHMAAEVSDEYGIRI